MKHYTTIFTFLLMLPLLHACGGGSEKAQEPLVSKVYTSYGAESRYWPFPDKNTSEWHANRLIQGGVTLTAASCRSYTYPQLMERLGPNADLPTIQLHRGAMFVFEVANDDLAQANALGYATLRQDAVEPAIWQKYETGETTCHSSKIGLNELTTWVSEGRFFDVELNDTILHASAGYVFLPDICLAHFKKFSDWDALLSDLGVNENSGQLFAYCVAESGVHPEFADFYVDPIDRSCPVTTPPSDCIPASPIEPPRVIGRTLARK